MSQHSFSWEVPFPVTLSLLACSEAFDGDVHSRCASVSCRPGRTMSLDTFSTSGMALPTKDDGDSLAKD